jgi:hypothetical protein
MKVLGLLSMFMMAFARSSEPGEIPLNSPAGPVGGEGTDNIHWYQQESMRAERYADKPPKMPSPVICNPEDTSVDCYGTPMRGNRELLEFAGLTYVLVYVEVDDRIDEPSRFALAQLREATRTFQRSGVPVQFLIAEIKTVDVSEDGSMTSQLINLRGRAESISRRTGADLVIRLLSPSWVWNYCGVAALGSLKSWPMASITACYTKNTLAHEIGHNFGLLHDRFRGGNPYIEGGVGYITDDESEGTVMSYAGSRIPFFSSPKLLYKNRVWGDAETNAVNALRSALGTIAMAYENLPPSYSVLSREDEEIVYCED